MAFAPREANRGSRADAASPTTLPCLSYSPFRRDGHAPFDPNLRLTREQIAQDLTLIRPLSACVRIYGMGHGQDQVPEVARTLGMKVVLGAWIDRDEAASGRELDTALRLAREHADVVRLLVVGNEVLLRQERTPQDLAALLARARSESPVPVAYADVWEFWLRYADTLVPVVDVAALHILPYWEDVPVGQSDSVSHLLSVHEQTRQRLAPLPIWVAATGWPAFGRQRGPAVPGEREQAMFLRELRARAGDAGVDYNVIEAFDQPWKRHLEGAMGGYWGLMKPDGQLRDDGTHASAPSNASTRWAAWGLLGGAVAGTLAAAGWWFFPIGAAQARRDRIMLMTLPGATALIGAAGGHHLSTLEGWSRSPWEWFTALMLCAVVGVGALNSLREGLAAGHGPNTGEPPLQSGGHSTQGPWSRRMSGLILLALCLLLLPLVFDGRYRPLPWSLVWVVTISGIFSLQQTMLAHATSFFEGSEGRFGKFGARLGLDHRPEMRVLNLLVLFAAVALPVVEGWANTQALLLSIAAVVVALTSAWTKPLPRATAIRPNTTPSADKSAL